MAVDGVCFDCLIWFYCVFIFVSMTNRLIGKRMELGFTTVTSMALGCLMPGDQLMLPRCVLIDHFFHLICIRDSPLKDFFCPSICNVSFVELLACLASNHFLSSDFINFIITLQSLTLFCGVVHVSDTAHIYHSLARTQISFAVFTDFFLQKSAQRLATE